MNEAARKIIDLMCSGRGNPLAPEHIETTRAALPIRMAEIYYVNACSDAFVAVGRINEYDMLPTVAWTSHDGTDGYCPIGKMVPRAGIEPATPAFSVPCSTN